MKREVRARVLYIRTKPKSTKNIMQKYALFTARNVEMKRQVLQYKTLHVLIIRSRHRYTDIDTDTCMYLDTLILTDIQAHVLAVGRLRLRLFWHNHPRFIYCLAAVVILAVVLVVVVVLVAVA